jgi:hypothetical protein
MSTDLDNFDNANKLAGRFPFKFLPWERQPGESGKAYQAFAIFRDLPLSRRTLTECARLVGKSPPAIYNWAKKWDWDNRCAIYDAYQQSIEIANKQEGIKAMNERQIEEAQEFQRKCIDAMRRVTPEMLADSPQELLKWYQISVAIERTARGANEKQPVEVQKPQQVINIQNNTLNTGVSPEQISKFKEMMATLESINVVTPIDTRTIEATILPYELDDDEETDSGTGEGSPRGNTKSDPPN